MIPRASEGRLRIAAGRDAIYVDRIADHRDYGYVDCGSASAGFRNRKIWIKLSKQTRRTKYNETATNRETCHAHE